MQLWFLSCQILLNFFPFQNIFASLKRVICQRTLKSQLGTSLLYRLCVPILFQLSVVVTSRYNFFACWSK
ncbi:hypothetical protein AQUCO_05100009v1 [Aquilegia coerulea]|uniref:Uncharacterized protein n=1 Tax=Aquilegia coerulea TaxID=218851 RepID=A0A2G5CK50_AQUCA|nr:hypothetical protein AQUCO_05100009v1 [Aquilegia coerulea]